MYKVIGFNILSINVLILLIVQIFFFNIFCDWVSFVNVQLLLIILIVLYYK